MARERADVVVVGGGLLGLATARALRGRRDVLVLEQVAVGHRRGGSYGPSRIFRLGYPDAFYVRLAQVARDRWQALEEEVGGGVPLLEETGQLSFGARLDGLMAALTVAGAPVRRLDAAAVEREFPALAGHGDAIYEPASGVLAADRCLNALRRSAGCEIREGTRVRRVADDARRALVATDHGELEAEVVVLCPGPWSVNLLPSYAITATFATLEHVAYLRPRDEMGPLPIFIEYSDPALYGLPTPASNLYKLGFHHAGPVVDPDHSDLDADPRMVERLEQAARSWLPAFEPEAEIVETCLYDNTPDEDFVIDRRGRIVMGAGTSGHGFKFGPLLGEMLAALVEDAPPPVDLARFSLRRFGPRG